MVKYQNFFIYFILLFESIFNQNGIIKFPFIKELPNLNEVSPKDVFPKMVTNIINIDLRVGTNPQNIKLRLDFESYIFYINEGTSDSIKFNSKNSKTYQKMEDRYLIFDLSKLNRAIFSSDYIYYNKNDDKKYNTSFLLGLKTEEENIGGIIGLNLDDNIQFNKYSKYNFLNELKRIELINDYYFTINYQSNSTGNLIIGDLPHNYDNNYNKEYYKDIYVDFWRNDLTWKTKFNEVDIADGKKLENKIEIHRFTYAYFKLENSFIEGTEIYRINLLNIFLKEQIDKNLCFEINNKFYYSYYCKKEVDISKMKNLYFYNKDLDYTFELTYKDLCYFNEYDGYNYILVIFRIQSDDDEEYNDEFWVLGEPIFKKYQFVFNKNSKRIGIYTKFDENNDKEDNNINNQSWIQKNKWYLILIILLFISICGLGIMIFIFLRNKPKRKTKANELDDEYDYSSGRNNFIVND